MHAHVVVEFGLLQDHYSVSEQPMLNSSTICIEINNGTLQREVVVTLNTVDITTESKYQLILLLLSMHKDFM